MYELTELGSGLQSTVLELGRFGGQLLGEPEDDAMRPGWYVVSMLATFKPELAGRLEAAYELRIEGQVFHLAVRDGQATLAQAAGEPSLVVISDLHSFLGLLAGTHSAADALQHGLVQIHGDPTTFQNFVRLFQWPVPLGESLEVV